MKIATTKIAAKTSRLAPLRSRLYGFKILVAKLICHPLIGRLISRVFQDRIPSRVCVILTASDEVLPSIKASIYWGIYESGELRFIQRYLLCNLDVVELGSSLGVVSSHICHKLNPGRRLVCVEANPRMLPLIDKNTHVNSAGARVEVVHAAIHYSTRRPEHVSFSLGGDNTNSRITGADTPQTTIQVPVLALSEILQKHQIGNYTLVCDIEGAESGLINCDARALEHCQQIIIELHASEWGGQQFTIYELQEQFEKVPGFRLRDQHGPVYVFERCPSSSENTSPSRADAQAWV